jgi:hypothetical protein
MATRPTHHEQRHQGGDSRHDGARTETKTANESELGSDNAGGSVESEDRAGMHEEPHSRGARKRARIITR